MFIQPCFIRKNTPELRGYLEGLGYSKIKQAIYYDNIMCANNNIWFINTPFKPTELDGNLNGSEWEECIDCGTNEKLFKAIAALRDDSDYLQWFVWDEPTIVNETQVFRIGSFFRLREDIFACSIKAHKATVEELIEKFK